VHKNASQSKIAESKETVERKVSAENNRADSKRSVEKKATIESAQASVIFSMVGSSVSHHSAVDASGAGLDLPSAVGAGAPEDLSTALDSDKTKAKLS